MRAVSNIPPSYVCKYCLLMTDTERNTWTKPCETLHPHFGRKSEKCGKVWWGVNQREPQLATRELLELQAPCHARQGSSRTMSHPKMQTHFLQVPRGSKKAHFSEWKHLTVARSGQLFALFFYPTVGGNPARGIEGNGSYNIMARDLHHRSAADVMKTNILQ